MATAPRLAVQGPTFTPAPFGLLSVAQLPTVAGDEHWRNGVEFTPDDCAQARTTLDSCPDPAAEKQFDRGVVTEGTDGFSVYAAFDCSPAGFDYAEARRRAGAALIGGEARAVEAAVWTGVVGTTDAEPAGAVINPHLAADTEVFDGRVRVQTAADVVATAATPVAAFAALEQALGECYGGVGVIHAPRRVMPYLFEAGVVRREGNQLMSQLGTLVAAGTGYPGSGPDGVAAPEGETWLYATGAVAVWRSPVYYPADDLASTLNRDVNTLTVLAERDYTVGWECCHLAANVVLEAA